MISSPNAITSAQTEYLWKTYSAVLDLIKFSDTKAGAILAANGGVIGISVANIPTISGLLGRSFAFPLLLLIGAVSLYLSAIFCLLSLIPNLSVGEPSSIIFFAHIAHKSKTVRDYTQAIDTVFSNNTERNQVEFQVWALSRVAKKKYFLVGWGIGLFAAMVMTTLGFIALAVLMH